LAQALLSAGDMKVDVTINTGYSSIQVGWAKFTTYQHTQRNVPFSEYFGSSATCFSYTRYFAVVKAEEQNFSLVRNVLLLW